MSGGSMGQLHRRVADAAMDTRHDGGFDKSTPERRAFAEHLVLVAEALRAIEYVDSGDSGPGDEDEAILECIRPADVLAAAVAEVKQATDNLVRVIEGLP